MYSSTDLKSVVAMTFPIPWLQILATAYAPAKRIERIAEAPGARQTLRSAVISSLTSGPATSTRCRLNGAALAGSAMTDVPRHIGWKNGGKKGAPRRLYRR